MTLPLTGIRILDLSRYLPGPFCTQLLADFGAEVVKIEQPEVGDPGRQLAPVVNGMSTRFYTVNRNKKSITLDIRKEEGREVFKKLIPHFDVVIDQFRAGFMDDLGIGYKDLKDINERIIFCAISGYGQDGPMYNAAGHDLNYLNLAGVTGTTGSRQGAPAMSGVQIADIAGGTLYAVIAILLALASREKTGRGQMCDVSMLDGALSLLTYTMGEWSGDGIIPGIADGVLTGGYACYNIYETLDHKYVSLGAVEGKFWAEFCDKLGLSHYTARQWKKAEQKQIISEVADIMKQKARDEWVEFFAQNDICFTPVLDLQEMSEHPQVKARHMVEKIDDPSGSGKTIALTGVPIKLSDTPGRMVLDFPGLGEHNEQILQAAGYGSAEIHHLRSQGII
ncbi:alpha-methylacyl-coa racemase [hydrocarbon metagenome]|uniref:Alpha-methylacyl-coa racemase n=1 Tax=hydrocarbon metagenome TaxID=938273 RepID=A0A0W8E7K7_9ZZZZ